MNFVFIKRSMLDFSDDRSQFVYSYKCPTFMEDCRNESDSDWAGWFFFALIMIGNVLADFINGIKLIVLSDKQGVSLKDKLRLIIGGVCLCFVSSLTLFASTFYNLAKARSNPEIISLICSTYHFIS